MPIKKVTRSKKIYRSKKRKSTKKIVPGPSTFFPRQKAVTLKYANMCYYNSTSGSGADLAMQFNLNSLYGPEGSFTGGMADTFSSAQPYYYDQIYNQYDNWVVVKTKIKVTYSHQNKYANGLDQFDGNIAVCTLRDCDDNSTLPSDIRLEMVRPNSAVKYVTAGNTVTITKTFDIPKLAGISYQAYVSDPSNWGVYNNHPTNKYYANALIRKTNYDAIYFPFMGYEIWQTAIFMGPTQVGMS